MINQPLFSYRFLQSITDWRLLFHRSITSLCSQTTSTMTQHTESCKKIQFYLERSLCLRNKSHNSKENKCQVGKRLSSLLIRILNQSRKYSSRKLKKSTTMNKSNLTNKTMNKTKWSTRTSTKTFQNTCLLFEKASHMEQLGSTPIKLIKWKWKLLSENSTENTYEGFQKTRA